MHRSISCKQSWQMFYIESHFCPLLHPPAERSCVIHPSGYHTPCLQHQDPASTGHRVYLRLHPGPTGRKCTDEHARAGQRYKSQLKASELTLRYQLLRSHFLPAFESWLSWQDIKTVWVSLIERGDKSVTDRRGRVCIPSKCRWKLCSYIMHVVQSWRSNDKHQAIDLVGCQN